MNIILSSCLPWDGTLRAMPVTACDRCGVMDNLIIKSILALHLLIILTIKLSLNQYIVMLSNFIIDCTAVFALPCFDEIKRMLLISCAIRFVKEVRIICLLMNYEG